MDFDGYAGEAMAMGERTPLALIDAPASGPHGGGRGDHQHRGRGDRASSRDVKLSANWMAPAGHPGEDAALYDTVRAVAMELCPALGISIPVGKDSMSMRTAWREGGVDKAVTAPLSLIVSAFAPVRRRAARADAAARAPMPARPCCCWIDLGAGSNRSAARRWRRSTGSSATSRRTSTTRSARGVLRDDPGAAPRGLLLAYHDRSDGGLFATLRRNGVRRRAAA